ncbi:hypothetical protein Tco_0715589 [Tanacetum coccineum]
MRSLEYGSVECTCRHFFVFRSEREVTLKAKAKQKVLQLNKRRAKQARIAAAEQAASIAAAEQATRIDAPEQATNTS